MSYFLRRFCLFDPDQEEAISLIPEELMETGPQIPPAL
jgi:hypothetical protein